MLTTIMLIGNKEIALQIVKDLINKYNTNRTI